jgi:hypothetical protein
MAAISPATPTMPTISSLADVYPPPARQDIGVLLAALMAEGRMRLAHLPYRTKAEYLSLRAETAAEGEEAVKEAQEKEVQEKETPEKEAAVEGGASTAVVVEGTSAA